MGAGPRISWQCTEGLADVARREQEEASARRHKFGCEDEGAIARLLLAAGADTSLRDATGRSALDWAQEEGLAAVASLVRALPP